MAETQAAKRLREYETIFLVKPDLTDDNVDKLKERVRGIVAREGGKVIRFTVWGKKKTAYTIAKQCLGAVAMFAPKVIKDSRSELQRSEDPYKFLRADVPAALLVLRTRLRVIYSQINPDAVLPSATERIMAVASPLATNPVTG